MRRRTVYLGLGSNLGDSRTTLRQAVGQLVDLVAVSSLYETEPVGGPQQDPYLNLVVELHSAGGPQALLALCRQLEQQAERTRTVRWGPRTLDVDVLLIEATDLNEPQADGFLIVDTPDLAVPHPRMAVRNFVRQPLFELAPELVDHPFLVLGESQEPVGAVRSIGVV